MILAVGTDIIEIARIRQFASRGQNYLRRVFTLRELNLADQRGCETFLAGRFAAKEAVAKCLGPPLGWHEVEILADENGKPTIFLHGRAGGLGEAKRIHLSISHSRDYAVAVAVMESVTD